MKKIVRLLSLLLVFAFVITLTGCSSKRDDYKTVNIQVETPLLVALEVTEGETFVGLLSKTEDKKAAMYLVGSTVPAGEYEIVTISTKDKVGNDGTYSFPEMPEEGLTFAGWYATENLEHGTRVTTNKSTTATVLYVRYISLADAGLITIVCMLIVFGMLALLWGIVSLFKFIAPKEEAKKVVTAKPVVSAPQKAFTIEDITDEDMMAAALVATIDYHNETGENVRVVSVKRIG